MMTWSAPPATPAAPRRSIPTPSVAIRMTTTRAGARAKAETGKPWASCASSSATLWRPGSGPRAQADEGIRMATPKVLKSLLRANPLYELVLYDRLPAEESRALADAAKAPGFYGILRPREGSGLGVKSVDRDTALLFLTLREPGPLPAYVRAALGEAAARTLSRLVADGVLEIETGGGFASGAAAPGLLDRADERQDGAGRLAGLSREALRYA